MTKSIIIAAAASAFLFAAPAFAQDAGCPAPGFQGPHGSATNLRDTPTSDPTAARNPAFNGPHGSASDLTDRPPSDPTAAQIRPATLYGRKAGDDKRQDYARPARPTGGLTKVGTGTLANSCR